MTRRKAITITETRYPANSEHPDIAAEKFYCTTPFKETEPIRYGNRVHKAAEMALLKKSSNDPEAEAPVRPYVETMLKSGWHLFSFDEDKK